jgi:DNA-binding transcriptional MocR family regulator
MPGHTNAHTRSASEAVAEVLAAHPEAATGAELATAAGVGQSTATKALATLEAEGRARRLPGGRGQNGRRQPDRWSPPEPPAAAVDQEPSPDPDPRPDPEPQPEKAAPPAAGRKAGRRPGDEYLGARLARGELAGLVLDYMADRPSETVGPASVAKGLGRSAGAVSNALGRLAEAGTVRLVGESPRRYRLARR